MRRPCPLSSCLKLLHMNLSLKNPNTVRISRRLTSFSMRSVTLCPKMKNIVCFVISTAHPSTKSAPMKCVRSLQMVKSMWTWLWMITQQFWLLLIVTCLPISCKSSSSTKLTPTWRLRRESSFTSWCLSRTCAKEKRLNRALSALEELRKMFSLARSQLPLLLAGNSSNLS